MRMARTFRMDSRVERPVFSRMIADAGTPLAMA